ncbi:Cyclin-like F-box [Cordyceps militaris CM01]|uniref:Cyclin-like F-box n=1 Tax=Cordyceps militaris (strain CM01) TaxID=983644 RepID=G3JSP9_CORMM|nr:Cyclin-like F-box [Cordyceps militaris CM01]EGX88895.1 Cyclin-like F-box [Cordyceps militaris CM01]
MDLYKLYTAVTSRRSNSAPQDRDDAPQPQLQHNPGEASATELEQLPRAPAATHFTTNGDEISIKPRKLDRLTKLSALVNVAGLSRSRGRSPASRSRTARGAQHGQESTLLDRFFALPPELQFTVLSYLDFGDLERLRRTCHVFRASITPQVVRSLLHPNFNHHMHLTCRICLTQSRDHSGTTLLCTDKSDARWPLSSRCINCVWDQKGFDVGKKYLLGNHSAAFVCRWCGYPIAAHPAWNQPEFHKRCFKRYTQVVFLYYLTGVAQWLVVLIASGMCWRYFPSRAMWVAGVVSAGFVVTVWNYCLCAIRGTLMRTYHFALVLEALIFASWFPPLLKLYRINSQRTPYRAMNSYEMAMVVFILFNLICRGINIIGNAILLCEYKLWRHKKPDMSPARRTWIRTIELFIFFVEPQSVEHEYPAKWWFTRRRVPAPEQDDWPEIVGITAPEHQRQHHQYELYLQQLEHLHDLQHLNQQQQQHLNQHHHQQQHGAGPFELGAGHNIVPAP